MILYYERNAIGRETRLRSRSRSRAASLAHSIAFLRILHCFAPLAIVIADAERIGDFIMAQSLCDGMAHIYRTCH